MPEAPCADAAEREVTADLSWEAPWRHGGILRCLVHLLVVGRNPPVFWKPTAVNAVNLGKRAGRSRLQPGVGSPWIQSSPTTPDGLELRRSAAGESGAGWAGGTVKRIDEEGHVEGAQAGEVED
ncbi:hypothetical protein TRAPUB_8071 [Trametes pubescens]|uniref:Uncharacterized protein n=1 Tax=Trametes pubescens TaxID=154538 RepID=A0A1M2W675_TRAPU|nr:hypothetical protein TRAPUB_8071 [Trametes pubescens]